MRKTLNKIYQIKSSSFLMMFLGALVLSLFFILANGTMPKFAEAVAKPDQADKIIKEVHNYYSLGEKGPKGDKGDKGEAGEPGETIYITVPAPETPESSEPITSMPQQVDPPKNTGEITTTNPAQSSSSGHLILKE